MWPWGHAAFGYLVYSLSLRIGRRRPTGPAALVLAVTSQLPDLVDKPLAWVVGAVSSGYAVGHSVFVAVPLGLVTLVALARRGRFYLGLAAVVGYWSHLVGDVLVAIGLSQPYTVERVLWPVVRLPAGHPSLSAFGQVSYYATRLVAYLGQSDSVVPMVLFVAPPVFALLLWVVDGRPGLGTLWRAGVTAGQRLSRR